MNVAPLGIAAGAAGSPLAQTKGAELDRARQEVGAAARQVYYEDAADAAAGVGKPDGEAHEPAERDGDGRRSWERPPEGSASVGSPGIRQSKDPSRQSGNMLDETA